MRRCIPALALLAALLALPPIAHAEDCSVLTDRLSSVRGRMAALVASYPGTHLVIGLCGVGASQQAENGDRQGAISAFAVCALIGCGMVGFENCRDVTLQWFQLKLEESDLLDRMSPSHCR